jgi:hypothetical protein
MRHKRRSPLKRFARLHFWAAFFSFTAYLSFGFVLGPDFFRQDLTKRISALADDIITVTATVLGPPAQPIVTATPVCVSGAPRILLDWADDAATDTWDIERDSLPLSTGVIVSQYTDTAVVPNATYSYIVSAYGPMAPGSAVSALVSATALDCPNILPAATITIETLGNQSVASDRSGIVMDRTRPAVTGTTNIPDALIRIVMTNPSIQADIVANSNGYFSWIPPVRLENGNHILSVTVTDPNDASRTATDSFTFRTKDDDADSGSGSDSGGGTVSDQGAEPSASSSAPEFDIDFSVSVNSGAQFVFQGDELTIVIRNTGKGFPAGTVFRGAILDASGKEVYNLGELSADLLGNAFEGISGRDAFSDAGVPIAGVASASELMILHPVKRVPLSLEPGTYRIRIDAIYRGRIVSREITLPIRAWPLIRFGENAEVTYYEVASFIGTIFFLLLSLFILFLLLFVREYWLYIHHVRHVTERNLMSIGLISPKRKGVAK